MNVSIPLRIAVVGHTNTGKTSLLRTLTRERAFGEVSDRPATTRQVEGIALMVDRQPRIELFDTPGLENAGELYEYLDTFAGERHQGLARIEQLLRSPQAEARFSQEIRVLDQVLKSDVVVYVIDAREPVLGKYQDELAILADCARPVLPVLNFTAAGDHRLEEWRDALARVHLHTIAAFDTVVFDLEAELRLWDRLRILLDQHEGLLRTLMNERRSEADWRLQAAARRAAAFLLDVAAWHYRVPQDEVDARSAAMKLQTGIREQERACVNDLLSLYRFGEEDYRDQTVSLDQGPWRVDPFDPEAIKRFGVVAGTSTALGAAAGAAVDIATGGLSLGAGTWAGTALGAGIGGWRSFGRQLRDRLEGYQTWMVTDATLRVLAMRQQYLLQSLEHRGHAAQQPIVADTAQESIWRTGRLPAALRRARLHPEWSTLHAGGNDPVSGERQEAIQELAESFLEGMRRPQSR